MPKNSNRITTSKFQFNRYKKIKISSERRRKKIINIYRIKENVSSHVDVPKEEKKMFF